MITTCRQTFKLFHKIVIWLDKAKIKDLGCVKMLNSGNCSFAQVFFLTDITPALVIIMYQQLSCSIVRRSAQVS